MNAWFGKHWGAPICDDTPHAVTPVGMACGFCDEPIAAGDDGVLIPSLGGDGPHRVAFHYECNLRWVVGGVNHQNRQCTCCGGSLPPDPPELTKREAARAAVRRWEHRPAPSATRTTCQHCVLDIDVSTAGAWTDSDGSKVCSYGQNKGRKHIPD